MSVTSHYSIFKQLTTCAVSYYITDSSPCQAQILNFFRFQPVFRNALPTEAQQGFNISHSGSFARCRTAFLQTFFREPTANFFQRAHRVERGSALRFGGARFKYTSTRPFVKPKFTLLPNFLQKFPTIVAGIDTAAVIAARDRYPGSFPIHSVRANLFRIRLQNVIFQIPDLKFTFAKSAFFLVFSANRTIFHFCKQLHLNL